MTQANDVDQAADPTVRDEAMTRSEERLQVGVQPRAVTRAVIRKYIVTEEVTQTFTLRREEVRVEHIPVTDGDTDGRPSSQLDAEEIEIILHEERPVFTTEVVPVERVRVRKEMVTDHVDVSEQLRQERIDLNVDRPEA